jgi:hypothetical protein
MGMDHSPYAIGKQNIHLLWFDNRSYLTLAKHRMRQRLSFTIRSRSIIWGAELSGRTTRCPGTIRNA